MSDEAPVGDSNFFRRLAGKCAPLTGSLETLSGDKIDDTPTPMIARVAKAWATPIELLSCEQMRLLTSQTMGLKWLADPIAVFVREYPKAWVTFFPGDFTLAALRAFPELLEIAPKNARAMMRVDLTWLVQGAEEADPGFAREIEETLAAALVLARGHS